MNYTDYIEVDNAYNNDERELDAYIVMEYNKPEYEDDIFGSSAVIFEEQSVVPSAMSNIYMGHIADTTLEELSKEVYMNTKDAILERDYIKLDGTHYFLDKEDDVGYISNNLPTASTEAIFTVQIDGTRLKNKVRGITLYFNDNIPETINVIDLELGNTPVGTVINNDKEMVAVQFNEDIEITNEFTKFQIRCSGWKNLNHRIRLKRIEFGLIKSYYKEDILNMRISETVRKICTETPEGECDIVLNNINKDFDVLNENGIIKYLSKEVRITPYIGIKTENQGICYDKMGIFYLNEWKNNNDGTVNLNCKNSLIKIKDKDLNFSTRNIYDTSKLGMGLLQEGVYVNNIYITLGYILDNGFMYYIANNTSDEFWDRTTMDNTETKLMDFLQQLTFSSGNILYVDRDGTINIVRPIYIDMNDDGFVFEELSSGNFIKEPEIKKLERPKVIEFIHTIADEDTSTTQTDSYDVYEGEEDKIVRIDLKTKGILTPATLNAYKWGSASKYQLLEDDKGNIQANSNMAFMLIKGSGQGGVTGWTTINLTVYPVREEVIKEYYEENTPYGTDYELKTDNYISIQPLGLSNFIPNTDVTGNDQAKFVRYFNKYLNNYEMKFSYGGNARRKAGDTIKVILEEYERSMNIFIEKITFNYDGGLTCDIEGVDVKDGI